MKRLIRLAIVGVAAIALAACGDDSSSTDDAGSTGTGTGTGTADTGTGAGTGTGGMTFTGGMFQLTTHEVDDKCLDGAMDLLFMPNGTDKPYDLANKTELPGADALPSTYKIQLQAPFSEMDVTVEADGANLKIRNAAQAGVQVDKDNYGDCKADMTIDADITIVDNDNVTVAATVKISKFESAADQQCPQATTPCEVKLTMQGARSE